MVSGILSGGIGQVYDSVVGGAGSVVDGVGSIIDTVFGDGDGKLTVGSQEVSSGELQGILGGIKTFLNGGSLEPTLNVPTDISGSPVVNKTTHSDGSVTVESADGQTRTVNPSREGVAGFIDQVSAPLSDVGLDRAVLGKAATTIDNWDRLNAGQQLAAIGDLSTDVLAGNGIITPEEARDYKSVANSIGSILDPNATDSQKALAASTALANITTTSFTGPLDSPTSIGGKAVVGGTPEQGFVLSDGSTVSQQEILNSHNAASAVQALSVISSNADPERKVAALGALGIQSGAANQLISQTQAGNGLAALSLFNTAQNWEDMNDVQRAVSTMQTGSAVTHAISQATASSGATSAANSALGFTGSSSALSSAGALFGGAAIVAGGVLGIKQAATTLDAVKDMNQSQGQKQGAIGGATAGAGIGAAAATAGAIAAGASFGATAGSAVPVVGTLIGAAVGAGIGLAAGSLGSGKNTGQKLRDGWRDGLESTGYAKKINGSHHVTLANGQTYDLGKDGGHKLTNVDGTERHTFDVDWGNQVAVNSIPSAHLYALATGLNPTDNSGHGLFDRAVAQTLNAATSNATSVAGAQENIRAMLGDTDPRHIAMRAETLFAQNKISEQERDVYLQHINDMYGTKLLPTNVNTLRSSLVSQISQIPESRRDDSDKQLLASLTSRQELTNSLSAVKKRLQKESSPRRSGRTLSNTTTNLPSVPLSAVSALPPEIRAQIIGGRLI